MKISGINFNLFKSQNISKTTQNNPFVTNNVSNPFAGGFKQDIFQKNNSSDTETNFIARKTAEFAANISNGFNTLKSNTKEFFAPAVSFAGQIKNSFNKLNSITFEDLYNNAKKELSMLTLDKDVRKYAKMSISDLRTELSKELA